MFRSCFIFPHLHYIIRYLAVNVNKNNVRTDLPDVLVGDGHFEVRLENAQQLAPVCNHDLTDAAFAFVKLKIRPLAQPAAVPDIDHFLLFKIRKKHGLHLLSPFLILCSHRRFCDASHSEITGFFMNDGITFPDFTEYLQPPL